MTDDRKQIRQARQDWKRAFETRDVEAIMAHYAPEIVTFDIMPPLTYDGAAANRRDWGEFFAQFDGDITITFADEHVECFGDLGFVREFTRLAGNAKGKPLDLWTRETNCLRKVEGRWLIVHAHTSVPVDFETMTPCINLSQPASFS